MRQTWLNNSKNNTPKKKITRKMSKFPAKAESKRRALFESLTKAMAKNTSSPLTLEELATKIGVSTGKIYYYFESKSDLLYQLARYLHELIWEQVNPIFKDERLSPRKRLEEAIRIYTIVICEHWQLMRTLWWDVPLNQIPAPLAQIVRHNRTMFRKSFTRQVSQVIKEEGIKADPNVVALIIFGTMNSLTLWYRKGRSSKLSPSEIAELVLKLVFHGIFDKSTNRRKMVNELIFRK